MHAIFRVYKRQVVDCHDGWLPWFWKDVTVCLQVTSNLADLHQAENLNDRLMMSEMKFKFIIIAFELEPACHPPALPSRLRLDRLFRPRHD